MLLACSVALPGFAQANEGETGENRFPNLQERREERKAEFEERKADIEEHRSEMRERMEDRRERFASTTALRKAEFSERIKELVLKRATHASDLLDAVIERLEKLADRIEARIAVLTERDVDTTDAESALTEAREKIVQAKEAVEDVQDALALALESETPREALQGVKPLAETAKTALRAAHSALVEAIKALPNAQNDGERQDDSQQENDS